MSPRILRSLRLVAAFYLAFLAATVYAVDTGIRHPGDVLVRNLPWGDKLGHIVLFGLLTLVANLALRCRSVTVGRLGAPLGTVLVSIAVVVEELSQGYVASRTLDGADLAADALGVAVATAASVVICRRMRTGRSATAEVPSTTVEAVPPIDPVDPDPISSVDDVVDVDVGLELDPGDAAADTGDDLVVDDSVLDDSVLDDSVLDDDSVFDSTIADTYADVVAAVVDEERADRGVDHGMVLEIDRELDVVDKPGEPLSESVVEEPVGDAVEAGAWVNEAEVIEPVVVEPEVVGPGVVGPGVVEPVVVESDSVEADVPDPEFVGPEAVDVEPVEGVLGLDLDDLDDPDDPDDGDPEPHPSSDVGGDEDAVVGDGPGGELDADSPADEISDELPADEPDSVEANILDADILNASTLDASTLDADILNAVAADVEVAVIEVTAADDAEDVDVDTEMAEVEVGEAGAVDGDEPIAEPAFFAGIAAVSVDTTAAAEPDVVVDVDDEDEDGAEPAEEPASDDEVVAYDDDGTTEVELVTDVVDIEPAGEPVLPTMADLDEVSADLDRIDAALVALDRQRT